MDADCFRNQLRAYRVLLAILAAEGEDEMCRGCIGFDGATTRTQKGLRKLELDLEAVPGREEEKGALISQIALLSQQAERLPPSDDPT